MLVLHLGFHNGAWVLWGERPAAEGRAKPAATDNPQTHPYAASVGELMARANIYASRHARAWIWLPTRGGAPEASHHLVSPHPPTAGRPSFQVWQADALSLAPGEALTFLLACSRLDYLEPGVIAGPDVSAWSRVLCFAASLVARELYLPGLALEEKCLAVWEPVISGYDEEYLHALERATPGACFAACLELAAEPPMVNMKHAVASLVDALVRMAYVTGPELAESIHDAWLSALAGTEPELHGEREELAALLQQINTWRSRVTLITESTLKFGFRVREERREASSLWRLDFLVTDPHSSVLGPVTEAWERGGGRLQEFVLTALGQATAICPMLNAAEATHVPSGLTLGGEDLLRFLSEYAPALRQVGFAVDVPDWWEGTTTRAQLVLRARVASPPIPVDATRLSLTQLLAVAWEIALGADTISVEELEQLADYSSPLVKLRGQWIHIDQEQLYSTINAVRAGHPRITLSRLLRAASGAFELDAVLPVVQVVADGWVSDLLEEFKGKKSHNPVPMPAGFSGVLREYQLRGFEWMEFLTRFGLGACLADDMGLGKTVQALVLVQHYVEKGEGNPVLLICPTSIIFNWGKEAARFTPGLRILVHHGASRHRNPAEMTMALSQYDLVITSYALAQRDHSLLTAIQWGGVVIDEAQNIKNPESKQSRVIRSIPGRLRLALTGTPVENSVTDLWSIMEFLNPGLLGTESDFRRKFLLPIHLYKDQGVAHRLKTTTRPFILRRLKTDPAIIADLPPKVETKVFCTLTREQAGLYMAVVREAEEQLRGNTGMARRGAILAAIAKLKQICNHPGVFLRDGSPSLGRSGKLARLVELAAEILGGNEKALIFTQYVEMNLAIVKVLADHLGQEALFLHGGMRQRAREAVVERFQHREGPSFLVLSLKAGGTGLNLTEASHVIHFDRWWNPAVEDQATDRAHRIGQDKRVMVHKFICAGTLEEKIDDMISSKKALSSQVIGVGENWITELTTRELRDLWQLRSEAWGEQE